MVFPHMEASFTEGSGIRMALSKRLPSCSRSGCLLLNQTKFLQHMEKGFLDISEWTNDMLDGKFGIILVHFLTKMFRTI